jgi:hypothetical protein
MNICGALRKPAGLRDAYLSAIALVALPAVVVVYFSGAILHQRGFGGDLLIHLSLVEAQRNSIGMTGLPASVISLSSLGSLAPVPPMAGGISYIFAGYLAAAGLGTYYALFVVCALSMLSAMLAAYGACRALGGSVWIALLVGMSLAAYAWPVGDLFGRGGALSFIAGMASIGVGCLIISQIFGSCNHFRSGALVVFTGVALGTHVPSTVVFFVFVVPLVVSLLIVRIRRSGVPLLTLVWGVVVPVILGVCVAAYSIGTAGAWVLVSQQSTSFISSTSSVFVRYSNFLSFERGVPSEHRLFWEMLPGSPPPTLLTVQLPIVFVALLIFCALFMTCNFAIGRSMRSLIFATLFWVFCLTLLIVNVPVWSYLPSLLQSLQYSFRLLYVLIFLLTILAAVVLPRCRILFVIVILLFVSVEIGRSVAQVYTTPNLTLVRAASGTLEWGEDVPVSRAIRDWKSGDAWYAASEWKARDGSPFSDGRSCDPGSREMQLAHSVHVSGTPGACVLTSVVAPAAWLAVVGGHIAGRSGGGGIVLKLGADGAAVVSLDRLAPPRVFGFVSLASFGIAIGWFLLVWICRLSPNQSGAVRRLFAGRFGP